MNSIFGKLRDFVGLNDSVEYDYEYDEMEGDQYQNVYPPSQDLTPPPPVEEDRRNVRRPRERTVGAANPAAGTVTSEGLGSTMNNVIGMPGALNGISEVVVMEPRTFEEMPAAIRALKERKSVVLNLTMMDPDQAQRAVDFVAGGTYALDGHQERIGESIFLFTPSCVQVRTQSGVVNEMPGQGRTRIPSPMASMWQSEKVQQAVQ
ncbi:cell division protein sepF [Lyngbya aestuarii BL J]|uniref:Cell division protein SepF n=1 Tax=Lyngbya aestuarii BL J TaxID=1348334 RepID=U7Q8N7_9CYAN|nr:cell division protein SepF [Lyngbya aestuarii]ERT04163.1 cell division protein sepF [Lyngbya aestuarii BL J]